MKWRRKRAHYIGVSQSKSQIRTTVGGKSSRDSEVRESGVCHSAAARAEAELQKRCDYGNRCSFHLHLRCATEELLVEDVDDGDKKCDADGDNQD